MSESPVERTDAIKSQIRDSFGDLFKVTYETHLTRDKGYYGICYVKASKNVRNVLSVDREILTLISTFEDQQPRTLQTARDLIAESEGRLDSSAVIIVHCDPRGNAKLKTWGREKSLAVLPIFYKGKIASGEDLLHTLAHELYSYDVFDITGPVADDVQFYGRREEARNLARKLQSGQIRSCFGIRKIGKTSILHRIINEVKGNYDCTIFLIDAQSDSIFTLDAPRLLNSIAGSLMQLASRSDLSITVDPVAVELSIAVERLRNAVAVHGRQILIVFDEIDYLTPTSPTAAHWRTEFNRFWRNLRSVYQSSAATERNLSLLISGVSSKWFAEESIDGVENAALAFVPEEYLSPLPRGAATAMIKRLGRQAGLIFTDATAEQIAETSADMPFWIRKACSYIHGKVEIALRPFEPQVTLISDYLNEFVASDGVAMSEVALAHLFRVYPELKGPALVCADQNPPQLDNRTLRTLEKYGVVRTGRNFGVSGRMMAIGLESFRSSKTEVEAPSDPESTSENSGYGDWADELAIISRRRNILERKLRGIVANFIRFSAMSGQSTESAKERVLKCVDAKRRSDLQRFELDDLMSKLYWLELISVVKKEWSLFEKIFGGRDELEKHAKIVNERPDAHAKDLDMFGVAYHRTAVAWFEDRLHRF